MLNTEVRLGAVVEVDAKHARKIARMFNDFLDGIPSRIAHTTVLERSVETKDEPNGKQVPRSGRRNQHSPVGPVE